MATRRVEWQFSLRDSTHTLTLQHVRVACTRRGEARLSALFLFSHYPCFADFQGAITGKRVVRLDGVELARQACATPGT